MYYWDHSITTTATTIILELHRTAAAAVIDQKYCFLLEFLMTSLLSRCCQIQRLTKTKEGQ